MVKPPTQRILRRNENILKRYQKGMKSRAIGKMFKMSHAQVMNIVNELKQEPVASVSKVTE